MASSSKASTAAVLLLLLALALATAADAAKMSIASEPRASEPIFPRPVAKESIASEPRPSGPNFPRPVVKDIVSEPAIPRPAAVDVSATCMGSLLALSPCLAFFRDAGTSKAPAGCCDGLGEIVQHQPACMCHIINHTLERAIGVDIPVDRALGLLGDVCDLTLPEDLMTSCSNGGAVPPLYVCPAPSA